MAAESGAPTALATVELLVGAGAAVCAEDEAGWTPCDRAILLRRACNMKVGGCGRTCCRGATVAKRRFRTHKPLTSAAYGTEEAAG